MLDALLAALVVGVQGAEVESSAPTPLDSAYGVPTAVKVELENPPAEAAVRIRVDQWGRARESRSKRPLI
ncbi:MAG: hypothetical protein ACREKI_09605 [Gemmatimonadota bacterium]